MPVNQSVSQGQGVVNLAGLLALEGEGKMIHQSIISCSPNDTASNPGRLESSTTLP